MSNTIFLLLYQNSQVITLCPLCSSRSLASLVELPSPTRPDRRVDRDTARGDRRPDDRGMSEPVLGCAAGPRRAYAGGLRTGEKPANAHRQGPPAPGQLSPAQRGLLPHHREQAVQQQADAPAALPCGDHLLQRCAYPQRATAVLVLQYPQEHVAVVTARQRNLSRLYPPHIVTDVDTAPDRTHRYRSFDFEDNVHSLIRDK